jgi:hypothetical protein
MAATLAARGPFDGDGGGWRGGIFCHQCHSLADIIKSAVTYAVRQLREERSRPEDNSR